MAKSLCGNRGCFVRDQGQPGLYDLILCQCK